MPMNNASPQSFIHSSRESSSPSSLRVPFVAPGEAVNCYSLAALPIDDAYRLISGELKAKTGRQWPIK